MERQERLQLQNTRHKAIDGRLSYMIYFKNKKQRKAAGLGESIHRSK
jgi:hypothetical protein